VSETETTLENGTPALDEARVRQRVRSGVALLAIRGALLKAIGVLGTLVLTQLLTPHDFGILAIGFSIIGLAFFLGDAGLGSAYIRRPEPPTRLELGAVVGLQATVAGTIAVAVTGIAVLTASRTLEVGALMAWSLPIISMRVPGQIMLEREIRYRPQITVELVEVLVYNSCAIAAAALGAGVWGVAGAIYGGSLGSVIAMRFVSPVGLVAPSPQFRVLAGTLRFSTAFQAANLITVGRDQAVNFGIAGIAGVAVLGLWSITFRLLAIPYLVFQSLWRVSFPGMARLLESGADPRPIIERSIGLSATFTGFVLAGLVGSSPIAIPALLGHQWTGATTALPWACLGLLATPISTAAAGFLYAKGDAGTVLRTTAYQAIAMLAVGLGLLHWLGLTAIGLGWLAAHLVDGVVIARGVRRFIQVDVVRPLLGPVVAATASAGAGWLAASVIPSTVLNGILLGLAVLIAYVGVHAVAARGQLIGTVNFLRRRAGPQEVAVPQ